MDASSLSIRPMIAADLSVQEMLVEQAGWNQLRSDLERMLSHQPAGCFVGEMLGRPVATITTTSYGADLAWIGMMLVHADYRRRGIATALLKHAIAWLHRQGVGCIKLDATHEGAAVYSPLGFRTEYGLTRYVRPANGPATPIVPTAGPFAVPALDRTAFGADRSVWLMQLAAASRVETTPKGYAMLRPGRSAAYLGPVVAQDVQTAKPMIERLLDGFEQSVFWDLPDPNFPAQQLASSLGFAPLRRLTRMWAGGRYATDRPELLFGLGDFATG